jgi:hypothetical protein
MADEPPEDAEFKRWFAEHDPFGTGERPTTDESPGDAEFKYWLEEQYPFGNREGSLEHEIVKSRMMGRFSSIMWFGLALPYMLAMVGILALGFLIAWAIKTLP